MTKPKLIAVVGPTASGKTSLSIDLAERFDGEVISCDSRQVYRGLDLGTGKVTEAEMRGVPHHLLDIADPTTVYTAADFERDATEAVRTILDRDHLPIFAGGTFFYLDILRGKMAPSPVPPNEELRAELEQRSDAELYAKLEAADARRAATTEPENRRRVIRYLEIIDALGAIPEPEVTDSLFDWLVLGVEIEREPLKQNIRRRLDERLEAGLIEEVEQLHKSGLPFERMEELGLEYRYVARYLKGELDYGTMVHELTIKIGQYAKRQMTWLKRDPEIVWVNPKDRNAIFDQVETFLRT